MSRKLTIGIALLGLGAILGGLSYWWMGSEISVRTAGLEDNVEIRVFGIGTVEAQVLSKIGFQVAGKVVEIGADQGDFVKKGSLLAKLDDAAQRAKLMKSEAALRQAAANLGKTEAQRDRAHATYQQKMTVNARRQTLVARGSVSQEIADDAQVAEEIAKSDLRVVEADTAIASVLQDDAAAQQRIDAVLLDQHELRAPFDGRVIARHRELGGVASAGEAVFTMIASESIWVRAYVDEALAGGLAIGQTAFVRLRSEADQVVEAEVVRIDQENDRVTEERRVYVRCRACGDRHQFRHLGEQAEVEIVKRTVNRARLIPLSSVDEFDGRSGSIWVVNNGRLAKRRVQFGDRLLDGRIQITSDIPDGVAVVIEERRDRLREGRRASTLATGGS